MASTFLNRRVVRLVAIASLLAPLLAACGGSGVGSSGVKRAAFTSKEFGVSASPRVTKAKYPPRGGGRELPLKPYRVAGKTYTPVSGPGYLERGSASWYGQDFHGRRTANGEIFGAYYLTAASPVLPIPSYARVTNLENGRSVLVRVNDRGPYLHGRVIDLSYQAASILDYVNAGSANVEVRYVGPAPLHGDDTKMLMASVNRATQLEAGQARLAMLEEPQPPSDLDGRGVVGSNGRVNFDDYQKSRGSYSGKDLVDDVFGLFGYADSQNAEGAHAAARALASNDPALQSWVARADADDAAILLQLGVFRDSDEAAGIAAQFAVLAAVDEQVIDVGGDPATVLTLLRLRPGVSRTDVLDLTLELGLTDLVLY